MKTTMEQLLEAIDGRPFVERVEGKVLSHKFEEVIE